MIFAATCHVPPVSTVSGCLLERARCGSADSALFVSAYCLSGIPIWVMTIGRFADRAVTHLLAERERRALRRPLSAAEFEMAEGLFQLDGHVDMAEFMALELLRLGKIDTNTLDTIKREFQRLDKDGDGHLKASEIELE